MRLQCMSVYLQVCLLTCVCLSVCSRSVFECVTLSAYMEWLRVCPCVLAHSIVFVCQEVQTSVCLGGAHL